MAGTSSVRRLDGRGDLLAAATEVLHGRCDLAHIRGLVTAEQLERFTGDDTERLGWLHREVPEFRAVDELVARWWERHGYRDYEVAGPQMYPGDTRTGGIAIHFDDDQYEEGATQPYLLFGPLSMSIAVSDHVASFAAERSDVEWFRTDRTYDPAAVGPLAEAAERRSHSGPVLRTTTPQHRGDAVLFATHPRPSLHSVDAPPERQAQLFEYCLVRRAALPSSGASGPTSTDEAGPEAHEQLTGS